MPYIDPQVIPIIENMKKFRNDRGPVSAISPQDMRNNFSKDVQAWNKILPELDKITDFTITTGFGEIPVRLYDPQPNSELLPTLIFIHGGGWIVGDLDTNERFLRLLAKHSRMRVLSIDYPLAPENPFPIALDCIVEIIKIVHLMGHAWGIDTSKISLGGDSAGANLALSAAIDLKNKKEVIIKQLTLLYGAFSPATNTPSFDKFGQGEYGMGKEAMDYFWKLYLKDEINKLDPRAVPLLADLSGLPPVHIISAGLDALQDDSFTLAKKLSKAKVKNSHAHYPGVVHGFVSLCLIIDQGDVAISEMADILKNFFIKNTIGDKS